MQGGESKGYGKSGKMEKLVVVEVEVDGYWRMTREEEGHLLLSSIYGMPNTKTSDTSARRIIGFLRSESGLTIIIPRQSARSIFSPSSNYFITTTRSNPIIPKIQISTSSGIRTEK